jgi:hypothetical protein
LQQDARELVELAQRRRNPGDPIEAEVFDVLQLAGDAQQRYNQEAVRQQDRAIAPTITIRAASAASRVIALRSIEARKSLAGMTRSRPYSDVKRG